MRQYVKNKWKGLDNFECVQCRFSTLDEKAMKEHVTKHPTLPVVVEKPKTRRKKRVPMEITQERKE